MKNVWVWLMFKGFWLLDTLRLWCFDQILKHGTQEQFTQLIRDYYSPLVRGMGLSIERVDVLNTGAATDKAGMLKLLGEGKEES